MRSRPIVPILALILTTTACAAIFSSGPDPVNFGSDPEGAEVIVNGQQMGTTPVTLRLHPDKDHTVMFRRAGYEDAVVSLTTHVQGGWVVLDILAGIIGVAIDAGTGEWKAFDSGEHFVTLQRRQ